MHDLLHSSLRFAKQTVSVESNVKLLDMFRTIVYSYNLKTVFLNIYLGTYYIELPFFFAVIVVVT